MGSFQMLEVLTMEHRWGKRVPVDVPVRLRCRAGDMAEGRIVNISLSGALIRTHASLGRLTRVDIHLNGRVIPSYVSRIDSTGIGVEWCEPSQEIRTMVLHARLAAGSHSPARLPEDEKS
jgi:hypothetical protein